MDVFGILDPDLDPHKNLCGSETLAERLKHIFILFFLKPYFCYLSTLQVPVPVFNFCVFYLLNPDLP